jgi:hypothetical protein
MPRLEGRTEAMTDTERLAEATALLKRWKVTQDRTPWHVDLHQQTIAFLSRAPAQPAAPVRDPYGPHHADPPDEPAAPDSWELPHGIPDGENDPGWPEGTPEHVKQPAAPEPSAEVMPTLMGQTSEQVCMRVLLERAEAAESQLAAVREILERASGAPNSTRTRFRPAQ